MNCKQGDLAIIVKSRAGNEGKIVTCLRLATTEEISLNRFYDQPLWPVWIVDRNLQNANLLGEVNGQSNLAYDATLRPIRDQDGEDEMIRIAGKPLKQELPQTTAISK